VGDELIVRLIVRGRSECFHNQARFVFILAAAILVLQLVANAAGLTGDPLFIPFGFCAAATD